MKTDILLTALEFANQGISVVPVATDGTKRPGLASWKEYQERRATTDELMSWFTGAEGVGVICGKISGNLEMLELEGRAVADKMHLDLKDMASNAGLEQVWDRINNGYVETTPSGGIHWLYRVDGEVPGNTVLASRPGENDGKEILSETRGEGGFSIVAPTNGTCHPSGGAWTMLVGSAKTIPTLTVKEREALHQLFTTFDLIPKVEFIREQLAPKGDTSTPGNDYNSKVTWDEILEPLGWKKIYTNKAGVTSWRRPGKNEGGISATTNHAGNDKFYVFSSSTQFEAQRSYSKFAIYTIVEHQGDFTAAARALRSQGYGAAGATPIDLSSYTFSPFTGEITASPSEAAALGVGEIGVDYLTQQEIKLARARREAKRLLDIEEATAKFKMPEYFGHLGEELKLPREQVAWQIKDVFPTGANVTLTAQYKAGKTTLINSLARSLADGEKFLNYFEAPEHPGRIVIFNYEVNREQYRRWFDDVNIKNQSKVSLYHMKGSMIPMIVPHIQDLVVDVLKRFEAQTWILDPFAGAFTGAGDENSNSDVTVFLNILDNIKERAGVSNLVIPIHTGRAQEHGIDRARGATRLDDWADVRWILKKTPDGRFFSADGRDVLVEEQALRYDEATRALSFGGADAFMTKKYNNEELWFNMVIQNQGKTTSEISALLNKRVDDKSMQSARKSLLAQRKLKTERVGSADVWYEFSHFRSFTQDEVI